LLIIFILIAIKQLFFHLIFYYNSIISLFILILMRFYLYEGSIFLNYHSLLLKSIYIIQLFLINSILLIHDLFFYLFDYLDGEYCVFDELKSVMEAIMIINCLYKILIFINLG
jgi:hypothetical protein